MNCTYLLMSRPHDIDIALAQCAGLTAVTDLSCSLLRLDKLITSDLRDGQVTVQPPLVFSRVNLISPSEKYRRSHQGSDGLRCRLRVDHARNLSLCQVLMSSFSRCVPNFAYTRDVSDA